MYEISTSFIPLARKLCRKMLYSRPLLLCLSVLHLLFCPSACLSYDPADYLEVYPDPRDPAVLRGRTPLHFALIQSLGGPQFDGSGSVAGVKVALDRINNDSSILPGYTLHYTFADSKVRPCTAAIYIVYFTPNQFHVSRIWRV